MSKKRTIAIAAGLSALMMACAGAANTATATPTGNSIYVDGTKVNGAAYMINSNNYFKLRDIAAMVNGSAATRAAADFVTASNDEDGIAIFIEEHLL